MACAPTAIHRASSRSSCYKSSDARLTNPCMAARWNMQQEADFRRPERTPTAMLVDKRLHESAPGPYPTALSTGTRGEARGAPPGTVRVAVQGKTAYERSCLTTTYT